MSNGDMLPYGSDRLVIEHPGVTFNHRRPCRFDPSRTLPQPKMPADYPTGWHFCVEREFLLAADGRLSLRRFLFPDTDLVPQIVDAPIVGNFSLVLEYVAGGSTISVPFRSGVVVEDESRWEVELRPLTAMVTRVFSSGFLVQIQNKSGAVYGFLPRSLSSKHRSNEGEIVVGEGILCDIIEYDVERQNFVVSPVAT
jgi:hypothetical protein